MSRDSGNAKINEEIPTEKDTQAHITRGETLMGIHDESIIYEGCQFLLDIRNVKIGVEDLALLGDTQRLALIINTKEDPLSGFCMEKVKFFRAYHDPKRKEVEMSTPSIVMALSRVQFKRLALEIKKALEF